MSGKELEQVPVADETGKAGAETTTSGIANEIANQLKDFEGAKKIQASDSGISSAFEALNNNIQFGISEKERAKAVGQLGGSLQQMLSGDLSRMREMMVRHGISTAEVDKKIKAANEQVEAVKPLQEAIVNGDMKALQKMVGNLKPEQLAQMAELLQKNFDRAGLGIELDYANGQLIVSRSNGDRAVAISADKTDVIGINKDGSYDFSRQYRHENAGKELKGMAEDALSSYLYPPRPRYWKESHILPHVQYDYNKYSGGR